VPHDERARRTRATLREDSSGSLLAASDLALAKLGATTVAGTGVAAGRAGRGAKVLDGLAGKTRAAEEDGVGASGLADGKLVEGDALTASLDDAGTGSSSEAECTDGHLGDLEHAGVVDDGADADGSLVTGTLHVGSETGEGDDRAVDAGLDETLQDLAVEGRVGATGKELVQTDKESKVGIRAVGTGADVLLLVIEIKLVDCHLRKTKTKNKKNRKKGK